MNQSKYLVHAFLLLAVLVVTFLFLNRVISTAPVRESNTIDPPAQERKIVSSKGRELFNAKCASCHHLFKVTVAPPLANFEERGPWHDKKNIYAWIKNPAAFMSTNKYTQDLKAQYGGTLMQAFEMPESDIDEIINYIREASTQSPSSRAIASNSK
jgi:mono/diheme cytochrome c family protein